VKLGDMVKLRSSVGYVYAHDSNGILIREPLRKSDGLTMVILERGVKSKLEEKFKVLTSDGRVCYIFDFFLEVINEPR
jgi:hypothetical protein